MSQNRLMYDRCASVQQIDQSVAPGHYMMYPGKYENCNQCRMMLGQVGGNEDSLYTGNMVDLESDLKGINREASLCNASKYRPKCKKCSHCKESGIPCDCLECTSQNLAHLPDCQMVKFGPVIPEPPFKPTECYYPQSKVGGKEYGNKMYTAGGGFTPSKF